jgi:methyl-accepting chemotaxis protein
VAAIGDASNRIASAAEEQGATADEVWRNASVITDVAAETARGASQTAEASREVARLASELEGMTRWFKVQA